MAVVQGKTRLSEQYEQLAQLLRDIQKHRVQPEDRYEIAALLESMGWNDDRAAGTFGVDTVFELAGQLWDMSRSNIMLTPFSRVKKIGLWAGILLVVTSFLRGAIFALPMAVSIFSMTTLRFSLWSYENLTTEIATSIALGTILSFITVGGFTQAIARRGFFYIIQGYYGMARKVTFYFIGLGSIAFLFISVLIFVVNTFANLFPMQMILMLILYYFFLNTIWLSVTVMYILKKELVFTFLIVVGIAIVYFLFVVMNVNIIVSQIISLFLVSWMALALAVYFFKKAEQREDKGIEAKLPKMSVTIFNTLPYFVYGVLYFTFLFVDRIIAWSADNAFLPYFIWFRGDYELGLDFSLLVLIIPMGLIEVVLYKLMSNIQLSQQQYLGQDIQKMNGKYIWDYFIRVMFIFLVALVSAVAIYYFLPFGLNALNPNMGAIIYHNKITHFVFIVSLIAYTLVAVALMNAVTLFSLSQPKQVIKAIVPSLMVNLILGFVLSRWFGYEYAVIGLLIGSMVFVVLSSWQVYSVLRKLDYYMYVAS